MKTAKAISYTGLVIVLLVLVINIRSCNSSGPSHDAGSPVLTESSGAEVRVLQDSGTKIAADDVLSGPASTPPEQEQSAEADRGAARENETSGDPEPALPALEEPVQNVNTQSDVTIPAGDTQKQKITIFLSPGHGSRRTENIIGLGGLVYGSSSGNTNEISNMLIVSQRLKAKLEAAGYDVVLAREDNNSNPIIDERIQMARDSGAVIGISIHSTTTLNSVWYQEMGGWRENNHTNNNTPGALGAGSTRIIFGGGLLGVDTDTAQRTAGLSKKYAAIIAAERMAVEGRSVITTSDASGSFSLARGLTTFGNIALEMLIAEDIPWVYCEFGTKTSDNSMSEQQIDQYVEGLLNGILAINFSGD